MTHTIIIPHRNRNRHLSLCLEAIHRSADLCGVTDYQILVVDNGSDCAPECAGRVRIVRSFAPMPVFNKSALLNIGLARVTGGVVTVLDADAVVGPRFLEGVLPLEDSSTNRVCYRVRYLSEDIAASLCSMDSPGLRARALDALRDKYNAPGQPRPAWEAYRFPDRDRYEPQEQPWGNSQFSMRRCDLEGLRYDEAMAGKGMEDIDFNRLVYNRFGANFRGRIWTDADHAMFHLRHPKAPDFDDEALKAANLARYKARWPYSCERLETMGKDPWS